MCCDKGNESGLYQIPGSVTVTLDLRVQILELNYITSQRFVTVELRIVV
jgi:hypothetical protein